MSFIHHRVRVAHAPLYFSSALGTHPESAPSSNVSSNANLAFAVVAVASAPRAAHHAIVVFIENRIDPSSRCDVTTAVLGIESHLPPVITRRGQRLEPIPWHPHARDVCEPIESRGWGRALGNGVF